MNQLYSPHSTQEDEISLADLVLVLFRHKKLILFITLGSLLLGAIIAWLKTDQFAYRSSIEIGYMPKNKANDVDRLIEAPAMLKAKIEKSYIPNIQFSIINNQTPLSDIKVYIPKGSDLLVLETVGPKTHQDAYLSILSSINNIVLEDHNKKIEAAKNALNSRLEQAKISLAELNDPSTLKAEQTAAQVALNEALVDLERLNDRKLISIGVKELENRREKTRAELSSIQDNIKLSNKQIDRSKEREKLLLKKQSELEELVNESLQRRKTALDEVDNAPKAMTIMLIDNEINKQRQQLNTTHETLMEIRDYRDTINNQLQSQKREIELLKKSISRINSQLDIFSTDNLRDQKKQQALVSQLQAKLDNLTNTHHRNIELQEEKIRSIQSQLKQLSGTRILSPPMPSLEKVSPKRSLILLLSLILGTLLACTVAFFTEFTINLKKQVVSKDILENRIAA